MVFAPGGAGGRVRLREVKFSYEQLLAPVRGAKHFFIKANVLFCVPKENQKSTRYFRGAGGTNQGLLALDNPGGVVETEKS